MSKITRMLRLTRSAIFLLGIRIYNTDSAKMSMWSHLILGTLLLVSTSWSQPLVLDEAAAITYLEEYDRLAADMSYQYAEAAWKYETNITEETLANMTEWSLKRSDFNYREAKNASRFDLSKINNQNISRLLRKVMDIGTAAFPDTVKLEKISDLEGEMTSIYSRARGCLNTTTCLPLEPDLVDIIANSRNYAELTAAWKGWRDASGRNIKKLYPEYVSLLNEAITFEGKYKDMGDYYRSSYESPTFENDVKALFLELAPLYENLHAYVRRRLKEHYGADKFPSTGHIPAHILGNMWAQDWTNIYDLVAPYPDKRTVDITKALIDQNYTIIRMYKVAEDFFSSIGLYKMPHLFWEKSLLVKPVNREVVCHASAWDFSNKRDFRIKQCTALTEEHLLTVHHEMGHIIYYLAYKDLPYLYREGANPGFHEGMADIVTLSFQTPEHMKKIGLLDAIPGQNDTEGDINFLFRMALSKAAFLPFGYLVDQWRWSVFRGETKPERYNEKWWDLRCDFQGIYPPVERSNADFDPGAKYHIPGGTPYISYFVSFVAQFQWHKALCKVANIAGPLHRCDIYSNTIAGARLNDMLKMGSSRPWGEAMLKITSGTSGQTDKLSVAPLLEYFDPLIKWLQENNKKYNEILGWDKKNCPNFLSPHILSGSPRVQNITFILTMMSALFSIAISIIEN
ncbi:hypothetical protein CHS0354_019650 [Potamilus streckersoni]|uniref:Angiotensin-converting enzyme n=1 Tax=Potamilus streckersoni TaxID=2493646 RepID=A0AAE0WA13_9BIVA|nr:hypothetical protein CHS0354_019650 [Potamilus streckersoni]